MSHTGELSYFLGLQIKQLSNGIFINQEKYCGNLIKCFDLENTSGKPIPMSTTTYLEKDEHGKNVDQKLYRSMFGSLLYLTASRPDITMNVCLCARFQADPKESHQRFRSFLPKRMSIRISII